MKTKRHSANTSALKNTDTSNDNARNTKNHDGPTPKLTPVTTKIGEGFGNLRSRSTTLSKRRQSKT